MANPIYEFDPVTRLTAGALGQPGHRTFYIQADRGHDRITMLCEKEQVLLLAQAIDDMLESLEKEHGVRTQPAGAIDEEGMAVQEPVEPLFEVGSMALGYDYERDRLLLVVEEALVEGEGRDPLEVRLFAGRQMMRNVAAYARLVGARGRTPEQRTLQAEAHSRRNGHGE